MVKVGFVIHIVYFIEDFEFSLVPDNPNITTLLNCDMVWYGELYNVSRSPASFWVEYRNSEMVNSESLFGVLEEKASCLRHSFS